MRLQFGQHFGAVLVGESLPWGIAFDKAAGFQGGVYLTEIHLAKGNPAGAVIGFGDPVLLQRADGCHLIALKRLKLPGEYFVQIPGPAGDAGDLLLAIAHKGRKVQWRAIN